jgi:enamine deaminase RidA (YjgF/YER057c/UK114 family)
MVGDAPLNDSGNIRDHSNMETQMRQSYANAKTILSEFGATLDDVVEEVLYVTDMDTAFAAAGLVRKEAYWSQRPEVASTVVATPRLALHTKAAKQPMELKTVDLGPLGGEEVEVAVEHCGLCHSNLSVFNDDWGISEYPAILGHEVVGRVPAVGANAKRLQVSRVLRPARRWRSRRCSISLRGTRSRRKPSTFR